MGLKRVLFDDAAAEEVTEVENVELGFAELLQAAICCADGHAAEGGSAGSEAGREAVARGLSIMLKAGPSFASLWVPSRSYFKLFALAPGAIE